MNARLRTDVPFVAVLDRSDALVRSLAKAVDTLPTPAEVQLYTRAAELDAVLAEGSVDVLLVGPRELSNAGLKRLARWHQAHPGTVLVLACEKDALPDPELVVRAGASRLLRLPAGPAAVRRALLGALEVAARQRAELSTVVVVPEPRASTESLPRDEPPEVEEPVVEQVPEPPAEREPGVTITVASATGGCGKTFLATNLAYLLARSPGTRVVLVDLDLQFGEVAPTLRLAPTASLCDVTLDETGHADLTGLLTPHTGGFEVLAAPPDPVAAEQLDHAVVQATLAALRADFDYVIVDTPPTLNEVVLEAFDVSDHLLVLATLDIPSIRNMRVFLSTLSRLRIPTDGLHLILNKAERHVELSPSDIVSVLGRSWDLELPYDREVSRSVNLGLPVSEAAPHCQVSRRLTAGVPTLVPGAAAPPAPARAEARLRSWLRQLRHRPAAPASPTLPVEENRT